MYIVGIDCMEHRTGHGLEFSSLDEVADTIRTLGVMLEQKPVMVEGIISDMRWNFDHAVSYSPLADALTRRGGPRGPMTGPGVLMNDGIVLGARFYVHNGSGLKNYPPFQGLEIRVTTVKQEDDKTPADSERYKLTVSDIKGSPWPTGLESSSNRTETMLAAKLGITRPISWINLQVEYAQDGELHEFRFVPLLAAINSLDGIQPLEITADAMARRYYDAELDLSEEVLGRRPFFTHRSGCQLRLSNLSGIEQPSVWSSQRQRVTLDGHVIIGRPCEYYPIPHVDFRISPGESASDADITALAAALTDALWANNTND